MNLESRHTRIFYVELILQIVKPLIGLNGDRLKLIKINP